MMAGSVAKPSHTDSPAASANGGRTVWVAAGLATAVCGWVFVELTGEVLAGDVQPFDDRVMAALRCSDGSGRPVGPNWLVEAGRDITALGGPAVLSLVTVVAVGWLALRRRYRAAAVVALAVVCGTLLCVATKAVIARERPGPVGSLVWVSTPSYPSGHAKLSTVVYMSLGLILAREHSRRRDQLYILGVAVAVTLLVGSSRVYLGVHYPTDVLGGWVAGLAWALPWWAVARRLPLRREPDR